MQTVDLSSVLADELASANAFRELLDSEREALSVGDLEQVSTIAEAKLVLAQRMQQHARTRKNLQDTMMIDGDKRLPDPLTSSEFGPIWKKLSAQLERAQEANRINGLLISSRLATVGNAITALHNAAGNSAIYHSDGSFGPVATTPPSARWSA